MRFSQENFDCRTSTGLFTRVKTWKSCVRKAYISSPDRASQFWMLRVAQDDMMDYAWLTVWPGLLIFLAVLAFNFIGDGLRDALDPHAHAA